MKNTRYSPAVMAALALAALLPAGCSHPQTASANGSPRKVEEAPDPNVALVEHPELFQVARVETRRVPDTLQVTGAVSPDVSRNVPVNALTAGRVADVRARLGDEVRRGQVLLTMTSPDISAAISDYRKAQADELLARHQLERSQLLYSHGAIAQKEVQAAEDTEEKARVDVQTTAERIRILGGDLNRPSALIEVRAPVSGTIVEQNVTTAAGVKSLDNSPNLFTIADLSRVWVLCDVYENNLAQVHLGDRAFVTLNAYPDRRIEGRVSNISSLLDPQTRTAKVRVDLPNPAGRMRPNMFATVQFMTSTSKTHIAVPVSAVLRLQDRDWVFVREASNRFRRTEVQAGPASADGFQQILAGVQAGQEIAANALQFSRAIENAREQSQDKEQK